MTLLNAVKYLAIASTSMVVIAFIYGAIHFWMLVVWIMVCLFGSVFFMDIEPEYTPQSNVSNVSNVDDEEDTSGFGFLSTLPPAYSSRPIKIDDDEEFSQSTDDEATHVTDEWFSCQGSLDISIVNISNSY